jgi:hypothetical protein
VTCIASIRLEALDEAWVEYAMRKLIAIPPAPTLAFKVPSVPTKRRVSGTVQGGIVLVAVTLPSLFVVELLAGETHDPTFIPTAPCPCGLVNVADTVPEIACELVTPPFPVPVSDVGTLNVAVPLMI